MTDNKLKRKILRRQSNEGWIVEIPVSDDPDGPKATVQVADWNDLLKLGIYPVLTVDKDGYVMVFCPKFRIYKRLARLIANANSDQEVSTMDGNELYLVRSNLILRDRKPPVYDRSFLSNEDSRYYADLVEYVTDWGKDAPIQLLTRS